jgi:hypothetical protein
VFAYGANNNQGNFVYLLSPIGRWNISLERSWYRKKLTTSPKNGLKKTPHWGWRVQSDNESITPYLFKALENTIANDFYY